jgi:tetratricopeptide (TPR) repeat protein
VAKETRKLRRAAEREQGAGKQKKADLKKPLALQGGEPPDPLGPQQLKATYTRVGLIVGAFWLVGFFIFAITQDTSPIGSKIALGVPAVVTVAVVGVLVWTMNQAKKARGVASILRGVETAEDRKAALEKLETDFKKGDPAKLFAKAQLEMQEDPRKALATLEQIDLNKTLGNVADEARSQRALIHLQLGEVSLARQLVDNIDLKRQQDPRSRAMMGAIVAEAWARSGQAQKAAETLDLFDLTDAQLEPLKPQIYRAYAFAYAQQSKTKELKATLRKLLAIDPRLLGGFLMKKTHPLLQREAKRMIEQSGVVPRKMQVQRRL